MTALAFAEEETRRSAADANMILFIDLAFHITFSNGCILHETRIAAPGAAASTQYTQPRCPLRDYASAADGLSPSALASERG